MRKGPLVIHDDSESDVKRGARNLPGVDTCSVHRLNVLQLAPGGHLGRFVVFTKKAFGSLNNVFGKLNSVSQEKSGYHLNRNMMACADLARIINSDQVQSKLRDQRSTVKTHVKNKTNPLTNKAQMNRLNPFAKKRAELVAKLEADRHAKRAAAVKAKRSKAGRAAKHVRNVRAQDLNKGCDAAYKVAEDLIEAEDIAGNYMPGDTSEEDED